MVRSLLLIIPIAFIYILKVSCIDSPDNSSFVQISQQDGLPNNMVTCMVQDHVGYIWLGTKRGLSKYDGYDFTNYLSDVTDSTSLPYHHITTLLETTDSTLLVGLWRNGLCEYNREQNNFSRIIFQNTTLPEKLDILQLYEDSKNRIWVIHQHGIIILNLRGEVIKDMDYSHFKEGRIVSAIFETDDEELLISSGGNIYSCNREIQSFTELDYTCDIPIGTIHHFYQFNDHTLWLASDYGLLAYDLLNKTIVPLVKSHKTPFTFILEDEQENIWFGDNFPVCYEKRSDRFHYFNEQSEQSVFKPGTSLTCGIIDNQKNLWFGSINLGASVLYNKRASFDSYPVVQKVLSESAFDVTAIFRDKDGILFLGTLNSGYLAFDRNEKRIDIEKKYPCLSALDNPGLVRDVKSDPNGNIWFGHNGTDGITIYNPENNRCEEYNLAISSFFFDSKGNNWIGSTSGLIHLDREQKQFTTNLHNYVQIIGISDLLEDNQGNIWIASYDYGLFLSDVNNRKLVKATDIYSNLPETKFISLLSDSRGRIWLGTEFYGLFYKDPDQDQFKQFTKKDGLPSDDICILEEDKNGNIWIGTNHGLSRFNHSTGSFKNYFIDDGLSGDEFNYNASFIDEAGVLIFGTRNGLIAFDPDNIEDDDQPLPIVINGVNVNNGNVNSGVYGLSVTEALVNHEPLTLKHNQNTISFKYSTINFADSKKSQFAFMLKGIDETYQYVGSQRQVNYTKIPPGEYEFSVIGSNNDNVWGENEATFSFIVRRHPMKSNVAFILYAILLFLIAMIVFRNIRRQSQLRNEIFIAKIAKEQQDELVKMKLRFFTNISHEFKTPLSLIIFTMEELVEELHGNSAIKKKLTHVRKNSQRLLTLINQLVEFRKMEQDALPVKTEDFNLIDITRNAMTLFSDMAEQRNINFEMKTSMQECIINSDKDKIEKIFNNILSNAFKHTRENGTISVSLMLVENSVHVSIRDTGSGMPEQTRKHIFSRFYQDEEQPGQFSGIGMSYVKKIIDLLDGTIEVNSKIDKGTEVIFSIPNASQVPMVEVFNKSETNVTTEDYKPKELILSNGSPDKELKPDTPRILVVEDDYEMREQLRSILQRNYNVDEAENGAVAFEMIQRTDYDLVLSDIMMPQMDGLELCSRIKSNPKTNHMILILLSAKDELESEMDGYKTGANVYLSKPFLPQKLLSIIKNQLYTQQKGISHHADISPVDTEKPIGVSPKEKEFIDQVSIFIEENLHKQEFGIERIGEEFGLSRSNLYKKFKEITNVSPKDFIKEVRMKKAVRLLTENNFTASEIAYDLGFGSATNFFTAFKAYYGKTPKEFQKEDAT